MSATTAGPRTDYVATIPANTHVWYRYTTRDGSSIVAWVPGTRTGYWSRPEEPAVARPRQPTSVAGVELFTRSWTALRAAVAALSDEDFARPSGCAGWLVRDLVTHLVIDAQDVLITLVTPSDAAPTRDAVTYWQVSATPPSGADPLDALIVRLAAAYEDPALLKFHLDDVGAAAGRAGELADPTRRVSTQDQVLTAGDFLDAYVLEWTLHHLDLVAHLPAATPPPADCVARTREVLETIAGAPFPRAWSDVDVLLVGTGRRPPTEAERAELGELAIPYVLG